ncbi:hypothetical protein ID854_18995 [Xenorhabdus sp. M]|uniref:Uncharacterized protein n=1 Tax=Xenorhabdus szentirmaii TaxID=290112 RepID=A0AAW3Z0A3_9GAMM|nr:hypothetical protein [Xenorhabdus sp. M]MBD2802469.1 hypothetical protein [Xenorhabdus sp. M]
MNGSYHICDYHTKDMIFSCEDIIECHDFSKSETLDLYDFIGVSTENVDFLLNGEDYSLKCDEFKGRMDFDFSVKKLIKSNDILYLYLYKNNAMYKFGALSLLKFHLNGNDERVWMDMVRESKKIIYQQVIF